MSTGKKNYLIAQTEFVNTGGGASVVRLLVILDREGSIRWVTLKVNDQSIHSIVTSSTPNMTLKE